MSRLSNSLIYVSFYSTYYSYEVVFVREVFIYGSCEEQINYLGKNAESTGCTKMGKFITTALTHLVRNHRMNKFLAGKIDKYIYESMVINADDGLKGVRLKKYEFLSAMLACTLRNIEKGYISKDVIGNIVNVLVNNSMLHNDDYFQTIESFKSEYGEYPPSFVVISPTQKCNLNCIGCYAGSNARTAVTMPFHIMDRMIAEVHDSFGGRFITISGGEPLMYESEGKTLFDIFEKYDDMFFLMYSNGTLIDEKTASRLAAAANVTPAVSVEGFERETDQRRGKGIFEKILRAFGNLRNAGVPFGISVTATKKNTDRLLSDDFYDFFFEKQGATYMWQFQLMPIGRGKDEVELMVSPAERFKLYRKWEGLLSEKKYCIADFWNSGVVSNGCIAYGRDGGYFYIDWNGNITPCVFIPYYVDNIYELYSEGKTLVDALFSDFMKNGRKWQSDYCLADLSKPKNLLMPCSIRDHYEIFRNSVMTEQVKPEDAKAGEALESKDYLEMLDSYDCQLEELTNEVWEKEYVMPG